jgi:hypothetical protein
MHGTGGADGFRGPDTWVLEQEGAGVVDRSGVAVLGGGLRDAYRVDQHAGRVRAVLDLHPDVECEFGVED